MVKKNNWKKKRKSNWINPINNRFYLFCEGTRTEPNYFRGFKNLIESNSIYKNLIYIHPCGMETVRVLDSARKYVEENGITEGQVWCIYDKDSFPKSDFNAVSEISRTLSNKNLQYRCAWSNECIEIWFILHFDFYVSNNSRKDYIKYLNDKFVSLKLGKYSKNMECIFDILLEFGNPTNAIKYAKKLLESHEFDQPSDITPGTKVYELIEEFKEYMPEEVKNRF